MPFQTADQAAIHILNVINPRSIIENFEYSGLIYRLSNGQYNYTIPRKNVGDRMPCSGQINRSNASIAGLVIPNGATEVGNYHTHGDYVINTTDENNCPIERRPTARDYDLLGRSMIETGMRQFDRFSRDDIEAFDARSRSFSTYRAYLGTPSGNFYYYDPLNDRRQHLLFRGRRPNI